MHSTKKTIGIVVLVIFIIGVIVILIRFGGTSADTSPSDDQTTSAPKETTNPGVANPGTTTTPPVDTKGTPTTAGTVPPGPKTYSLADVALHNSASSCWTTIGGKVYNLTTWINQHPGGRSAILSLCGKDGTKSFNAQHGGQARPEQELASFSIGDLK